MQVAAEISKRAEQTETESQCRAGTGRTVRAHCSLSSEDFKFESGAALAVIITVIHISSYNVEASVVVVAAVAISEERMRKSIRVGAFWFWNGPAARCKNV